MDKAHELISQEACRLSAELPLSTVQIVSRLIGESPTLVSARGRIAQLPQPHQRELATNFVEKCIAAAPQMTPASLALAVLTAGVSEKVHRDAQSIELVWTGPDVGAIPFRRTEQAILQVLDSAKERITMVSYAVYRIPNVSDALVRAARRGVQITVIVETPDRLAGENEYSTLKALGSDVASCSSVYYWPEANRQRYGDKPGILHVKCAVADGRWLFLSSANLTEYAFTINMELGVLLTGGTLPGQVEENFDKMVLGNILESV